jgi:hypothetical protein
MKGITPAFSAASCGRMFGLQELVCLLKVEHVVDSGVSNVLKLVSKLGLGA